eukprot:312461-Pyramimonas_sp.AAC.1
MKILRSDGTCGVISSVVVKSSSLSLGDGASSITTSVAFFPCTGESDSLSVGVAKIWLSWRRCSRCPRIRCS